MKQNPRYPYDVKEWFNKAKEALGIAEKILGFVKRSLRNNS